MPFDLKNVNPAARFFWPGDPQGEEWVELRLVSEGDKLALVKEIGIERKAEFVLNPLKKSMERIEYADTDLEKGEKFLSRINDLTIVAWFLKTPDGKKIPCTKENKDLLMSGSDQFSKWVEESLETLRNAEGKREEELEKNASSS